ncbi:unnamed protein product [Nezara viridula]|uniref:Uncharacterized protein n=1 Tax=Nezara viridula TaxID=85310 RepID=A0A9P0E4T9_NEZVI|nr:unnamed protein product [Nezara viridula]
MLLIYSQQCPTVYLGPWCPVEALSFPMAPISPAPQHTRGPGHLWRRTRCHPQPAGGPPFSYYFLSNDCLIPAYSRRVTAPTGRQILLLLHQEQKIAIAVNEPVRSLALIVNDPFRSRRGQFLGKLEFSCQVVIMKKPASCLNKRVVQPVLKNATTTHLCRLPVVFITEGIQYPGQKQIEIPSGSMCKGVGCTVAGRESLPMGSGRKLGLV